MFPVNKKTKERLKGHAIHWFILVCICAVGINALDGLLTLMG